MKFNFLSDEGVIKKIKELKSSHFHYPYYFTINKDNQWLYFLGVKHSNNPQDPQFERIKELFYEFLEKVKQEKSVVFTEINMGYAEGSEEKAIKIGGEGGLMVFLANKHHTQWYCPEPSDNEEILHLLKAFPIDEIMYYYFARLVNQWHQSRIFAKQTLSEYIDYILVPSYKDVPSLKDFDFSFKHFIQLHNKFHDHPFDEDNKECFYYDSGLSNKVSNVSGDFRDKHIVEEILKHWHGGKSVFIVYGSEHAFKQEPALKELLKS